MRLYHGSEKIVDRPVYGKGRKNNDYGMGFYCTEDWDLAAEWAVDIQRDGFVNSYDIDTKGMQILDLNSSEYGILHWISLLLANRRFDLGTPLEREAYRYLTDTFLPDTAGVDLIRGYRADDSYFSYAQDFISGAISVSQLKAAMQLGNLGEQIMIRSREAFSKLVYQKSEGVFSKEWYEKKHRREDLARTTYRQWDKSSYVKGDLYIIRILDEEVKPDDPCLR